MGFFFLLSFSLFFPIFSYFFLHLWIKEWSCSNNSSNEKIMGFVLERLFFVVCGIS